MLGLARASSNCRSEAPAIEASALSVRGARDQNEDAALCKPGLGIFAVSDGMGGYEGGALASRLAVEAVGNHFMRFHDDPQATWPDARARDLPLDESMVVAAFREAHRMIRYYRRGRLSRMGTTLALLYLGKDHAVIGHIGDSRVYQRSEGTLRQLTRDHSLYERMKSRGEPNLPPVEHYPLAHVITRALGMDDEDGRPELTRVERKPGDAFLLCTDGLSGRLTPEALAEGMLAGPSPEAACAGLVDEALHAGSDDNVTAVIVR